MFGALNPFRAKVIAALGALTLHATAFGALALAHLDGPKLAFDGAPTISVSVTTAPPQIRPSQTKPSRDLKAEEPKPQDRMVSADAQAVSQADGKPSEALATSAEPSQSAITTERVGIDPNTYAQEVWRHLAAYRPRSISGAKQARVQFVLDESGGVKSALIIASSGSSAFDRACLEAVQRAAPFPPDAKANRASAAFEVAIYARRSQ